MTDRAAAEAQARELLDEYGIRDGFGRAWKALADLLLAWGEEQRKAHDERHVGCFAELAADVARLTEERDAAQRRNNMQTEMLVDIKAALVAVGMGEYDVSHGIRLMGERIAALTAEVEAWKRDADGADQRARLAVAALQALTAEVERLNLRIECDLRDPVHKNCRNGESQLEHQRDIEMVAREKAEAALRAAQEEIAYLKRRVAEREEPIAKLTKMSHDDRQEIAGLKAMVAQARAALFPVESAPEPRSAAQVAEDVATGRAVVVGSPEWMNRVGRVLESDASPLATESKPCAKYETGWLIEIPGSSPAWWDGRAPNTFTTDSGDVFRMARQEDAVRALHWKLCVPPPGEVRITEHQWLTLPRPDPVREGTAVPAAPSASEERLRFLLWAGHGHLGALYGDDGEMQCAIRPGTDFKRDSVERIEEHIVAEGKRRLEEAALVAAPLAGEATSHAHNCGIVGPHEPDDWCAGDAEEPKRCTGSRGSHFEDLDMCDDTECPLHAPSPDTRAAQEKDHSPYCLLVVTGGGGDCDCAAQKTEER